MRSLTLLQSALADPQPLFETSKIHFDFVPVNLPPPKSSENQPRKKAKLDDSVSMDVEEEKKSVIPKETPKSSTPQSPVQIKNIVKEQPIQPTTPSEPSPSTAPRKEVKQSPTVPKSTPSSKPSPVVNENASDVVDFSVAINRKKPPASKKK